MVNRSCIEILQNAARDVFESCSKFDDETNQLIYKKENDPYDLLVF